MSVFGVQNSCKYVYGLLGSVGFMLLSGAAFAASLDAGLIGDILDPLLPPHSTPGLEQPVLVGIVGGGYALYPLLKAALAKRWESPRYPNDRLSQD